MNNNVKFRALDFLKHPELIQIDGNNVFAMFYDCKHAKLYSRYASIRRSLKRCQLNISYIKYHEDKKNELFVSESIDAHYISLITSYGRCFASGKVKLERRLIPSEYIEDHNLIMKLRNEYVAHLGGFSEGSVNYISLYPDTSRKQILKIHEPIYTGVQNTNLKFLNDVLIILDRLIEYVDDKLKLHYAKICEEIRSYTLEEIYSKFETFDLAEAEYSPDIRQGNYIFTVNITGNGLVFFKGERILA